MTSNNKITKNSNELLVDIFGNNIILPGEKQEEFNEIKDNLMKELNPVGQLEGLLCSKIIADTWRLKRLFEFEKRILLNQQQKVATEKIASEAYDAFRKHKRFRSTAKQLYYTDEIEILQKEQTRLSLGIEKAITKLREIQKLRIEK